MPAIIAILLALSPVASREIRTQEGKDYRPHFSQSRPGSQNPNYPQRVADLGAYKVP